MIRETIERTEFRKRSQFFFRKRNAPFEVFERPKLSILPRALDLFGMFLAQSVHHTKSKSKSIVVDHGAAEIGFRDADRLDLQSMPLGVFYNCRRRIKTHRLIIEQTRIKLRRAMHFQIRAAIGENG